MEIAEIVFIFPFTAAKNNVLNIALKKALFKHFFHKVYTFVTYKSCNNADNGNVRVNVHTHHFLKFGFVFSFV